MTGDRTTTDWLLTGLASASVDGPAEAAAEALRRLLEAAPSDTVVGTRLHWLGMQVAAAEVLWDREPHAR